MFMSMKLYRLTALLCALALALSLLAGCGAGASGEGASQESSSAAEPAAEEGDIVILYTNDVHCGISGAIGYGGLAAYRDRMEAYTPYVTLVDCGDAVQGELISTVSQGEFLIDLMNQVGYDYAILGNHEFDYGMDQLSYLIDSAQAQYLGCNISYTGSGENLLADVKPYAVEEYGEVKVAFIGVSTPYSITSSTPKSFQDDSGNFVYDFCSASAEDFYSCVQETVDQCREEGADYVVLLTHLGDGEDFAPFGSVDLIANTAGVDVVLDGHAHSAIPCYVADNKEGQEVLLSSTGTKLQAIGQLVITADGMLSTGLITHYEQKDADVEELIANIQATYEEEMNQVVAHSDTALSCNDSEGIRLVRNRETTIGNFCADAYREMSQADIALVNGGGIRADLPAGEITYADVLAVHPYGNTLCMVEATGQEILDALELSAMNTQSQISAEGAAVGESGGFLQVSGLKYTIDTSIPSSVVLDENGMFVSAEGQRRVTDVQVLGEDGSYLPLEADQVYTVASHNYLIEEGGDGYSMFADNQLLIDKGMADYEMLITYITDTLEGQLSAYGQTEGRITVK